MGGCTDHFLVGGIGITNNGPEPRGESRLRKAALRSLADYCLELSSQRLHFAPPTEVLSLLDEILEEIDLADDSRWLGASRKPSPIAKPLEADVLLGGESIPHGTFHFESNVWEFSTFDDELRAVITVEMHEMSTRSMVGLAMDLRRGERPFHHEFGGPDSLELPCAFVQTSLGGRLYTTWVGDGRLVSRLQIE